MRRGLPLAALIVALGAPPPAHAGTDALTLSVTPRSHHPAQLALVARVAGAPAGARVSFFVVSREFGQPHEVPLGVARPARGLARLVYAPTWPGRQRFLARLGGSGPSASASYRVVMFTPGPLAAAANPVRPLASVGRVFLDVILAVVALVWLSLVATLVLAFVRLPRLAGTGTD